MSLIIGAVVIIVIIAGAAFFMSGRSSEKNTTNTTQNKTPRQTLEKMEEVSVSQESEQEVKENNEERSGIAHQEKSTATVVENKVRKEEKEEKAQLYRYLNHELQNLFDAYNKGEWDKVVPGEVPAALYKEKDEIITKLSSVTGKMVEEYFSCIDFREEEGKFSGRIKDREKLKKVFLQFMMPFYPYYYKARADFDILHFSIQILYDYSSSLLVRSSVRDTEIVILPEYVLLSGIKIAIKYIEKMEDFYVMLFLARTE